MDTLDLHLLPHPDPSLDSAFAQVEIRINSVPLLDLVGATEESLTQREFDQRVAEGENPGGLRIVPGSYMYPTVGQLRKTRELSFGCAERYFVLQPQDADFGATVLMGCNCGEPGCWMLLIDSTTTGNIVTWSHFRQFHRPEWQYALGPYNFCLEQYRQVIQHIVDVA